MKRAGRPVLVLLAVLALTILRVGGALAEKPGTPGQQGQGAAKAGHTRHANGTVQAVSGSSITVLPKHGDPLTFTVDQATRVLGDASNGCAGRLLHPAWFSGSPVTAVPGSGRGSSKRPAQTVQLIDEYAAWERAEVLPIGDPMPVSEWLARLDQLGMTLGGVPPRRIAGGPYDGGWVVSADNRRGRLYFAIPAAASAPLQGRLLLA